MTVSPSSSSPMRSSSPSTWATIASVEPTCSVTWASTPQLSESWLRVALSGVNAITGIGER